MSLQSEADEALLQFLKKLDESVDKVTVTDWEAKFIESQLIKGYTAFSVKQREIIESMMTKYAGLIGW